LYVDYVQNKCAVMQNMSTEQSTLLHLSH